MQRGSKTNRWLDAWVGVPVLNLLATLRRKQPPPRKAPSRVALMCSPALGDTLLFSGVLGDLRQALPDAHITHICMRQNFAAAELLSGADERLVVDLKQPWRTIRQLREGRFEVFLDFTSWQRLTASYTLLSGARYTVGFRTAGQRRSRGYDRTVPHLDGRHETANFRALLDGSGLPIVLGPEHAPAIHIVPVAQVPFDRERDLVTFHLWASGQRSRLREWPEERWLALAKRLAGPETLFLVTGAPAEKHRMEPFAAKLLHAGLRAVAFVSPDGFRTLAQVLLRCRLVVTVNTGVMHLGAIAGARTVSINGPNRNGRWGPVGPRAIGVEAPGEGCGFLHLGFDFHGNPEDCMHRISVDAVEHACQSLLRATPEPMLSTEQLVTGGR